MEDNQSSEPEEGWGGMVVIHGKHYLGDGEENRSSHGS